MRVRSLPALKDARNAEHWATSSAGGTVSLRPAWRRLAKQSKCVPSTTAVDRKFNYSTQNAESHLGRLSNSETPEEVAKLRKYGSNDEVVVCGH